MVCLLITACGRSDDQIARDANKAAHAVAPKSAVSVHDGSAVISGRVANEATRMALDSVVKNIKGVRSVTDRTTAAPPPQMSPANSDRVLQHDIDSTLHANNIDNVHVAVTGGIITLTGSVKPKDLQTVLQLAHRAQPEKVINELTITR